MAKRLNKYETLYREGKEVSKSWWFYKEGTLEQIDKYKDDKRISSFFFIPMERKKKNTIRTVRSMGFSPDGTISGRKRVKRCIAMESLISTRQRNAGTGMGLPRLSTNSSLTSAQS